MLKKISKRHWPLFLLGNMSSLANLFLPIVLARFLSPQEMGLYKTFFLYLMLLPFLSLAGGPLHSVYFWAGLEAGRRDKYIKQSWFVTLFLSSFILAFGSIYLIFFDPQLPLSSSQLWCLTLCAFLVCPSGHYGEVCVARGEIFKGVFLSLSFEIVKVGGFIYLAWKGMNISWLFSYFLIMMISSSVFMTTLAAKDQALTFKWDKKIFEEILRYSLPVALSSGLFFLFDRIDLIILSSQLSSEAFAYYSLGCLLIPPLFLLEGSVQRILIPNMTKSYQMGDLDNVKHAYRKAMEDMSYLMIPSFFGLLFFSSPIIELLYSSEYLKSVPVLRIFSFSYLFLILPHDSILRATGKTTIILKTYLVMTPVILGGVYVGSLFLTPEGTLSLALLMKFAPKVICFTYSRKLVKGKVSEMVPWKKMFSFTCLSAALTALSYSCRGFFGDHLSWLLVTVPLFALAYMGIFSLRQKKNFLESHEEFEKI